MTRFSGLRLMLALALLGCAQGPRTPIFLVEGTVSDPQGRPLVGTVVSDGEVSTLSGEGGRFSLALYSPRLIARKPGFSPLRLTLTEGGSRAIRLQADPQPTRLGLDDRSGLPTSALRAAFQAKGILLFDFPEHPLSKLDVLWLMSPGPLAPSELASLTAWVRQGGRLILSGEWGGYPGQSLEALNALARPAKLGFEGATIKKSQENHPGWLIVPPGRLWPGLSGPIHFFSAGGISVGPGSLPLLRPQAGAYTVLADREIALLAAGACGEGKVIAVGDCSLWLDERSLATGGPNLDRGGNRELALALTEF